MLLQVPLKINLHNLNLNGMQECKVSLQNSCDLPCHATGEVYQVQWYSCWWTQLVDCMWNALSVSIFMFLFTSDFWLCFEFAFVVVVVVTRNFNFVSFFLSSVMLALWCGFIVYNNIIKGIAGSSRDTFIVSISLSFWNPRRNKQNYYVMLWLEENIISLSRHRSRLKYVSDIKHYLYINMPFTRQQWFS